MAQPSLFQALAALTSNLPSAKTAAEVGKTTHPVSKLDDGSKPVSTGAFAAEQSAGVKKQQNQLLESAGEQTYDADAAAQHTNLKATQTGKDPSTERDFTTKETDPGTTHPARVDKSAHLAKYASASMVDLYTGASDLANAILADFGNNQLVGKQASAVPPQTVAAASAINATAQKIAAAANGMPVGGLENDPFAAGYVTAAKAGVTKQAAEASVAEYLQKVAEDATLDAELCIQYFNKLASDMPPDMAKEESPASQGASNMAESGGTSASEGGALKKDEAAEGRPDAAAGLAGSGAESGMSQDDAMAALDEVLQELGVSPEELVAALQAHASGGGADGGMPPDAGGGMPPEGGMPPGAGGGMPPDMGAGGGMPPDMGAGGMPPEAGMSPEQGMKLASDIWARRRNMANLQKMASAAGIPISVQKASASSKVVMRSYLSELLGR